jgi:hypothetical protein
LSLLTFDSSPCSLKPYTYLEVKPYLTVRGFDSSYLFIKELALGSPVFDGKIILSSSSTVTDKLMTSLIESPLSDNIWGLNT